MPRLRRRRRVGWHTVAGLAAATITLALPTGASATTAWLYNFNMYTNTVNTYGGCRTPNGSGNIQYRWVDYPPTSSRISVNDCQNYAIYQSEDFGQHTEYRYVAYYTRQPGFGFRNFVFRGRSLGSIAFYDHDGHADY